MLLQCPVCKSVAHASCIYKAIRLMENPCCATCRNPMPVCYDQTYIDTTILDETWNFTN